MNKDINKLREKINDIDLELSKLIEKRLNLVKEIGIYKKNNHLNIDDKEREKVVYSQHLNLISAENKDAYLNIFQEIVKQSKILQNNNK